MGYIRATFIGKEYSIPEDVLIYIDLLDFTETVKTQLLNAFLRKVKDEIRKENTGLLGDEDLATEIEQQVGRFISKLCDNGIFTRTVSDYLNNNKGYQYFSDVNKAALANIKSLLMQRLDSLQEGYEDAVQRADSHVTGMGFSIWSSSFVNHAIYAAMEASTINKQQKEASAQYQKEIRELCSGLESNYNREKNQYINNEYIPNMEAALTVLAYELVDRYVADMIAHQKFDAKALDFINIGRSNDLLKNLTLSGNKKAILENAFAACPYNIAVYEQATKYELLDYDSFQTAKVFKQHQPILLLLKKSLGEVEYPGKFKLNYVAAKRLAEFTQCDVVSILQAKTTTYVDSVIKAYSNAAGILGNRNQAACIMSELSETAVLSGNSASRGKSTAYISGIVSQNVWLELTEKCGYSDLLDKIKTRVPGAESATTKHDVDLLLEEKLYPILEEARQIRENEIIKKREVEAKQRAADAESARRTAARNRLVKKLCLVAAAVVIIIAIASAIITKTNNAKAYQNMGGEFCVYRVINDDGEERDEFNWWLSIDEDGTMKMSSWSYAFDNTTVDSYSGELKNKADFRNFEDYRIEDYCADISEYEEALYCYEFHITDEWDEFDGYIVCWQYHNGKIVDVYCDDYRYSFVETSDDYSFNKWEGEINSDKLSKNVQKLVDNIDVSEEDEIKEIENLINSGSYDKAVEAIVASKLSDEQKNAYFVPLIEKNKFKSFYVNGLVVNVPEHWYLEDYSDPNIRSARESEKDSLLTWYIKCMGTIDQVVRDGDDGWRRNNDYSSTTVAGCEEAYIRRELNKHVDADEAYSVIDYYVVCQGFVYKIQYFAYNERFFEPEMEMLFERVEFSNHAENRADLQEQKYLRAIELINENKYVEALSILETIADYKDSAEKIAEYSAIVEVREFEFALEMFVGEYIPVGDTVEHLKLQSPNHDNYTLIVESNGVVRNVPYMDYEEEKMKIGDGIIIACEDFSSNYCRYIIKMDDDPKTDVVLSYNVDDETMFLKTDKEETQLFYGDYKRNK